MSVLRGLGESFPHSPDCVRLKAAILFYGVQFGYELAQACDWAFPNYAPYQLPVGMEPFRGKRRISIPYLLRMADDTQVRLRIKTDSPFSIRGTEDPQWFDIYEDDRFVMRTTFEPRLPWADLLTKDGTPMRATGLSQHGEMLVLNVAPGCEYFVSPVSGESSKSENLSCKFCLYGLPDKRLEQLGQSLFQIELPGQTYDRVVEACLDANTEAKQLYLVGGSMTSPADEGERFVQIAQALSDAGLCDRYYVACGSGAIPRRHMEQMKALGVRGACFNLEVWDETAFKRICPGKAKWVGRKAWLEALDDAVEVFGRNQVMTAFVGGVELEGDEGMSPEAALQSAIEAGEYLIPRGIQPLYSLYWRTTGQNRGEEPAYTLPLFLQINEALAAIRKREDLLVNTEFLSKRGAYMQLEPDYDGQMMP
jgi:hypothetical protein